MPHVPIPIIPATEKIVIENGVFTVARKAYRRAGDLSRAEGMARESLVHLAHNGRVKAIRLAALPREGILLEVESWNEYNANKEPRGARRGKRN